jgi:hypothetical protein
LLDRAPTAIPNRLALRGSDAQGYRLSSDELRSGLEVATVSITSLPLELVSELLRLRKTWGPAANGDSLMVA